jgi:predicted  nucleic acid-binding Zn-ribbon protein
VIADPAVQLSLLDLQGVDSTLARIEHRRRTLRELVTLVQLGQRYTELRSELVTAQTAAADLTAEQRRLESDVDTVRQRAARDQQRMTSAGVPAKEITGLQHEVASLSRRQGVLEDELLELMERLETLDSAVARLQAEVSVVDAERAEAEAARDAALAQLDAEDGAARTERSRLAGTLPADLVTLYDKVRAVSGGVGAALLRQRRCEGCHLELAGNELSAVRAAQPDAVLRCDNCRRILVRTAESGL